MIFKILIWTRRNTEMKPDPEGHYNRNPELLQQGFGSGEQTNRDDVDDL